MKNDKAPSMDAVITELFKEEKEQHWCRDSMSAGNIRRLWKIPIAYTDEEYRTLMYSLIEHNRKWFHQNDTNIIYEHALVKLFCFFHVFD